MCAIVGLCSLGCGLLDVAPQDGTRRPAQPQVQGSYDVETNYDLATLDGVLGRGVRSWTEPHKTIKARIIRTFASLFSQETANTVDSNYGGFILDQTENLLRAVAPSWLYGIGERVGLAEGQLRRVDVQSAMLLTRQVDGSFILTQSWQGISVLDDPSCLDTPEAPCAKREIALQEILDAEYPLDLVSADYVGGWNPDGSIQLDSTEVSFNYGRLGLYMLTNLVLPDDPTRGLQLRDVVLAGINCKGVAGRLAGTDDVLGWMIGGVEVGISLSEIIGSCESGVFGMVDGFVDQFDLPIRMNLGGRMQVDDMDFDGRIDQIFAERLTGNVRAEMFAGEVTEGPVSAALMGWRVGDLPGGTTGTTGGSENIDDGITIFEE